MNELSLFDPLFIEPFLNGLVLAFVLPVLGAYTRLRDEWLASLGVAQIAAAGVVIGLSFGTGALVVALVAAMLAAVTKTLMARAGNDAYAVMILVGWSIALLVAANTAHGDDLARALVQGQIYFTSRADLLRLGALAAITIGAMPWISRRLLLGRFFPAHFVANGQRHPHHDLIFDVLLGGALALAATVVGVMAAFALVFVTPWVVFRFARGWRQTLVWCALLGAFVYFLSFSAAIMLDQPFGPVMVIGLLGLAAVRLIPRH